MWASGNPHSDFAPELKANQIEEKIEEHRIQQIQIKAQNAKITGDFPEAFPEYQRILEMYTPSQIFGGSTRNNA